MDKQMFVGNVVLYRNAASVVSPGIINAVNRDGTINLHVFPDRSASYNVMSAFKVERDDRYQSGWFSVHPELVEGTAGN